MKKSSLFLSALLLSFSLAVGCGRSYKSASGDNRTEQMAMPQNLVEETMAAASADTSLSNSSTSSLNAGVSASEPSLPANRKLIRTVDMNLESTDFDNLITSISNQVSSLGGYLEQSNISGNSVNDYGRSQTKYATIIARIPSDKLNSFISSIEGSANVTNKSENVSDVTLQYTDIESHKKVLNIEQERLWALLEKADSVETIIALESRLSEIRYQLETYESQLRLYDNQVDYSTVSLYIDEVKLLTPTTPESVGSRIQHGFTKSLGYVKTGTVNFIVWLLASSPLLIVWGAILAGLFFVSRFILRKMISASQKTSAKKVKVSEKQLGLKKAQTTEAQTKSGQMKTVEAQTTSEQMQTTETQTTLTNPPVSDIPAGSNKTIAKDSQNNTPETK